MLIKSTNILFIALLLVLISGNRMNAQGNLPFADEKKIHYNFEAMIYIQNSKI